MANVGLAKHLADNWLIFPRIGKTRGKKTAEARKTWRRRRTRRRNARIKGREKEEEKEEEETRREGCRNSAPASLDLRVSRRWRQGGLIFYASFPPSRDPPPFLLAAKETSTNFVSPSYRTKPSWLLRPATWRRLWADAVQVAYEGEGRERGRRRGTLIPKADYYLEKREKEEDC